MNYLILKASIYFISRKKLVKTLKFASQSKKNLILDKFSHNLCFYQNLQAQKCRKFLIFYCEVESSKLFDSVWDASNN